MSNLVDEIRALLERGVTQKEIAEAAGVSAPTICRFIAGKHCPSYYRAEQIRHALDGLRGSLPLPDADQHAATGSDAC